MSRVVVLGAGVAGHTAAAFARKWLRPADEVIVVSPKPDYNWIPSNIWVGVGLMPAERVRFPLAPVYARHGIDFKQARATEIHPEGRGVDAGALRRRGIDARGPRGRARGHPLRLPHQRHRAEAELRRHRGPRARTGTACRSAPTRHAVGDREAPRRGRRADEARRAAALPGRHRARRLHLPGRGLRVHRQPGVRAAGARRARPRRHLVDLERVRTRRLRHGRACT